ncbi:MAG: cytochrome c oxidase subunit II [Candidatus Binatia bacterium]
MLERLGLMPPQASTVAGQVDLLYAFLIVVSAFFSLLIAGAVIGLSIKYRRRPGEFVRTPHIHGSTALEIAWSIIPFGITMIMFFWGAHLFVTLKRPPDNALQVNVVGRQWMWKVQHLEGRREINELHVPLGRPVKVTLTSEDVIHSFYVPAFRIKQDAVPGRYTTTWFEATKIGSYHLFCAEYCGTVHSGMIGQVVVMDPADYQAWLAGESRSGATAGAGGAASAGASGAMSVTATGEGLFGQLGCATCHRNEGGALGPSLAGLVGKSVALEGGTTVTADDDYLRESILTPQAKVVAGYKPVMPTFKGQVSEEQILALISYIKSLGALPAPAGAGQAGTIGSDAGERKTDL